MGRFTSIDIWMPVWVIIGVIFAMQGHISWWVFAWVILSHLGLKINLK